MQVRVRGKDYALDKLCMMRIPTSLSDQVFVSLGSRAINMLTMTRVLRMTPELLARDISFCDSTSTPIKWTRMDHAMKLPLSEDELTKVQRVTDVLNMSVVAYSTSASESYDSVVSRAGETARELEQEKQQEN